MRENISTERMEIIVNSFKKLGILLDKAVSERNEKELLAIASVRINMHMTCVRILSDSDKLLLNQRLS